MPTVFVIICKIGVKFIRCTDTENNDEYQT